MDLATYSPSRCRPLLCRLISNLIWRESPLNRTALLLGLLLGAGPWTWAVQRHVTVDDRIFPGVAEMDGNWAALRVARDGKVYAGLACHGCDGHLVYYDPAQDRMVDVGNLTRLCGESNLRIGPQSKIHAKFGEGKDGRIYFGTHAGLWFDYAHFGTRRDTRRALDGLRSQDRQGRGLRHWPTIRGHQHRRLRSEVQPYLRTHPSARSLCVL